jgi:GAF domain-containing protein
MNDSRISRARTKALEMQALGATLCDMLSALVEEAESVSHGEAVCSVLLIDEEGLLRNGASPGLPDDYLAAIDRLKPDPGIGTCAAAAATGRIVITPDLMSDAGWRELKHLPLALGLHGAWSVPLVASDGRILGTFGTYFRTPREPRPEERSAVEALAAIATGIVEAAARTPAVAESL